MRVKKLLLFAATAVAAYALGYVTPHSAPAIDPVNAFHKLSYGDPKTWPRNYWLGIQAHQNPNDVWITQEIIYDTKPDFIIETGTRHGGSALIWAMVMAQTNPTGKIITIDIKRPPPPLFEKKIFQNRIEFIEASSTDPAVVQQLAQRVAGKKAMVILDSNHEKSHVLNELRAYAPMIPVGGYLIVQDSNVNGHPVLKEFGPGPMEAIDEFLQTHDDFVIDKSKERLLFTFNPNGFLKRVK